MTMRRAFSALLLAAGPAAAQLPWNSSIRTGPQFVSYDIKATNQKISEFALPIFLVVPIPQLPALNVDIGTSYATVKADRRDADGNLVATSSMSGLTDTQLRANYTFGDDFIVLTAGLNLPTGSATIDGPKLEAATRIGSDLLTFPVSGFGSGFGATQGIAIARPMGSWNMGFGASIRESGSFDAFKDAAGVPTKLTPGPEIRARLGADRPFGTGRFGLGFTVSKYGDDKANAATFNSGSRFVTQASLSSSTSTFDYSIVFWDLFKTSGTAADSSKSPAGNLANATVIFGVKGPANIGIEPSIETRMSSQANATAFLGTIGLRLYINRGNWAIVPSTGFTIGSLESATLTGYRVLLAVRYGG